jgi:hypothetical protein
VQSGFPHPSLELLHLRQQRRGRRLAWLAGERGEHRGVGLVLCGNALQDLVAVRARLRLLGAQCLLDGVARLVVRPFY